MCDKECQACGMNMSMIMYCDNCNYREDYCNYREDNDTQKNINNQSQSILHMAHQSMSYRNYSNYEYVNYDDSENSSLYNSDCQNSRENENIYYPDNQFYIQSSLDTSSDILNNDPIISIQINEP